MWVWGDAVLSEHPDRKKSNSGEALRAFAYFSQIGITMAAAVLMGVLLGRYLDRLFGTAPWLGLVFSLLGAGAAIKLVFSFADFER